MLGALERTLPLYGMVAGPARQPILGKMGTYEMDAASSRSFLIKPLIGANAIKKTVHQMLIPKAGALKHLPNQPAALILFSAPTSLEFPNHNEPG